MRLRLFLVNLFTSSHTWRAVRDCADLAKLHFESVEDSRRQDFWDTRERGLIEWEQQLVEMNMALQAEAHQLHEQEAVLEQRAAAIEKDGYAVLTLPEARAWEWVKATLPGMVGYAGRPALEDKA